MFGNMLRNQINRISEKLSPQSPTIVINRNKIGEADINIYTGEKHQYQSSE